MKKPILDTPRNGKNWCDLVNEPGFITESMKPNPRKHWLTIGVTKYLNLHEPRLGENIDEEA